MADDLIEKLWFCANLHPQCGYPENGKLFGAAADRITALQAQNRKLVEAAKELQRDMIERSRAGMDVIHGEEYRIVNAGNSAWIGFCDAIAEAEKGEG